MMPLRTDDMTLPELLPCPKCGELAHWEIQERYVRAWCHCGIAYSSDEFMRLADSWNDAHKPKTINRVAEDWNDRPTLTPMERGQAIKAALRLMSTDEIGMAFLDAVSRDFLNGCGCPDKPIHESGCGHSATLTKVRAQVPHLTHVIDRGETLPWRDAAKRAASIASYGPRPAREHFSRMCAVAGGLRLALQDGPHFSHKNALRHVSTLSEMATEYYDHVKDRDWPIHVAMVCNIVRRALARGAVDVARDQSARLPETLMKIREDMWPIGGEA